MSKKDREKLGLYDRPYKLGKGEKFITKQIKMLGDEPVAFFDIVKGGDYISAVVGTRGGKKYRGKGYAKEVVKSGLDYWDKNKAKYGNKPINWWVRDDNIGSEKIAQSTGFKLNKRKSKEYAGWKLYQRK